MLEADILDLLPKLRPYQCRAAYWMVRREKGSSECSIESERSRFLSPLCMPVNLIDTLSTMFYNPFSYVLPYLKTFVFIMCVKTSFY